MKSSNIDLKSVKTFLLYIFFWLLATAVGSYIRLYPLYIFTPGDSKEKATLLVLTQLREKIGQQIELSSPSLTPFEKEALKQKKLNELLHQDRDQLNRTIDNVARQFAKKSGDQKKTPYLLESDPFYYYNLTENIVKTGKMSETVKGSKYLNKLMLTPHGHWEPFNLHPYVGFTVYRFLKIFQPDISLMYAVSFTPLIVSSLAVMAFLWIGYLLGCSAVISFAGSVYFILSPIFVKRSAFGWYDNDPYNAFFLSLIVALIFSAFNKIKDLKATITIGVLTFLTLTLYAFFWQGWVFIFSIIVLAGIVAFLINLWLIKEKTSRKNLILFFSLITVGSFLGLSLTFGPGEFFVLFKEGWSALKDFLTPQLSNWPDLYISVGELKRASLTEVFHYTNGPIMFGFAVLGLAFSFLRSFRKKDKTEIYKLSLVLILFLISLKLTLGAQRFAMIYFLPLNIGFLIGLQRAYEGCRSFLGKIHFLKDFAPGKNIILSLIFITISIFPLKTMQTTIKTLLNPIFNDTWDKALTYVRDHTPSESVVNTWWPPGHFIKAIAHRRVTFDGATINFPQAYWMADVFMSPSERQALGLLRMLNDSGNDAADYLQKLGYPLSQAVSLLKTITQLNRSQADLLLTNVLKNKEDREHLLDLTHKHPPPSYILIYNEFVDTNIQLAFFGKWNFKKIEEINRTPALLEQVPRHDSPEYVKFLWDLVGGPYRYSGVFNQLGKIKDTIFFKENIRVDLKDMTCEIDSSKFGRGIPKNLLYQMPGTDSLIEKKLDSGDLNFSALLYEENGYHNLILLDEPLARSLLMRLYYFNGAGFKHIKPFTKISDLTKRTVISVFEIDWDGFEKELSENTGRGDQPSDHP